MPEMHLTPFKTICLWRFTLNKERVQKSKEHEIHDIFIKTM